MKRDFFFNIMLLLVSNLLIKPFYLLGVERTVQNTVGVEEYGIYVTILNLTVVFRIIGDFGLQYFNNRNLAQQPENFGKYFSNIIVMKGILAIVFAVACYVAATVLGYNTYYMYLLSWTILLQLLLMFVQYMRTNVSGLHYYYTDSFLSILDRSIMIIICGTLLVLPATRNDFTIEWFIHLQNLSLAITVLVAFYFLRKHIKAIRFQFDLVFFKEVFRKTSTYALITFLMSLYLYSDTIILEQIHPNGAAENGIYYSAYRLLTAANMIGVLLSGLLLPMFSKLLKMRQDVNDLVAFSFKITFVIAVVGGINVYFYQFEIMDLLYDSASPYSASILGILMLSFIPSCFQYILGTLLAANENLRPLILVYAVAAIINLILNFTFIPSMAAYGASISILITQSFVFIALLALYLRVFRPNFNARLVAQAGSFLLGTIAINSLIVHQVNISSSWWINFGVAVLLTTSLAFLLRLIDLQNLLQLIRNRQSEE